MRTLSRRHFLLAGAGASVAALSAAPCITAAQVLDDAYEPWTSFSADAPRSALSVVHAAVLAANAHDTQPWKFHPGTDGIEIGADLERNLGGMDPFRREMHLSLGCALENAALMARSLGYAAPIRIAGGSLLQPSTLDGNAASIGLTPGSVEISPLVAAIPHRHTNRSPYQGGRSVPNEALASLQALAGDGAARLVWITDPGARRDFAQATVAATESIVADAAMIADSDHWFRGTDQEIAQHRDGPTLYCAGLSPMVLSFARLMPSPSPESSHRHWISQTRDAQLGTRPVIGLITVHDLYDRDQSLRAGRLWQRLHLQGTLLGLGMQPLNQLPECVDRELQLGKPAASAKTLARFCGDSDWSATFAFRIGRPTWPAPASPRRSIESALSSATT
ncbi:MAG TPA: hypothetical protein VGI65_12060 [Steroidobacteraceae bacterium]|jgi:hypothetical protein